MSPQADPLAYEPASYWEQRFERRLGLDTVGYLGLGWSYNRWLYTVRKAVLARALRAFGLSVAGRSVLELGVGSGFYLPLWQRLGARRVAGVDITEASVQLLRRRYRECRFERCDLRRPFSLGERFDIVTAFDVLFHITDEAGFAEALDNVQRHLLPGGWALFTDCFAPPEGPRARHVRYRDEGRWRQALRARGLEVVALQPQLSLMLPGVRTPGPIGAVAQRVLRLAARAEAAPAVIREAIGAAAGAVLYPWQVAARPPRTAVPGTISLLVAQRRREGGSREHGD